MHMCVHMCMNVCMHVFIVYVCMYLRLDVRMYGWIYRVDKNYGENNDYGEIHILRGYGGMFFGKKATQNSKKNSRMGVWCSFRVVCICIINPKN